MVITFYPPFFLQAMAKLADGITGVRKGPYAAVGSALEVIPRTLAQNCGASPIRTLTALRVSFWCILKDIYMPVDSNKLVIFQAKHATSGNSTWGINGTTGELVDMKKYGVWEPVAVKVQTYKTAVEVRLFYDLKTSTKVDFSDCNFASSN